MYVCIDPGHWPIHILIKCDHYSAEIVWIDSEHASACFGELNHEQKSRIASMFGEKRLDSALFETKEQVDTIELAEPASEVVPCIPLNYA